MNTPPTLANPPREYNQSQMAYLISELRRWFQAATTYQTLQASELFIDIDRFPTQADLANLRSGQVYRETPQNVLKVKP